MKLSQHSLQFRIPSFSKWDHLNILFKWKICHSVLNRSLSIECIISVLKANHYLQECDWEMKRLLWRKVLNIQERHYISDSPILQLHAKWKCHRDKENIYCAADQDGFHVFVHNCPRNYVTSIEANCCTYILISILSRTIWHCSCVMT